MKFLKLFFAAVAITAFLFSCTKTDTAIGVSTGTLKVNDTTGDCLPVTVHGTFTAGVALDKVENYIDIWIDVKSIGAYSIATDSLNGMSFKGSGRLGFTGLNRVRLYSFGKPFSAGLTTFSIQYNGTVCTASVIVGSLASGSFLLSDTAGVNLGTAVVSGIYTTGVQLGTSDSVTFQVNVTKTGSLYLVSNSFDGIVFSGTDVFTTTGIHTITLVGSGIPQAAGNFNFAVVDSLSDSTKFTVTVVPFGNGGSTAAFTLGGAPGACAAFVEAGDYVSGVKLSPADSITTSVTVTRTGAYSIVTAPVNGAVFSATGTFDTTGVHNVILKGSGMPLSPGTFNYTAAGDSSNCVFSINYSQGIGVYTLGGAPNGCTGFTTNGTYKTDSALTTNNTVTMEVNVVAVGAYSISTPTIDGISFSGSGNFVTTGLQTITLTGTGIPVSPGIYNFVTPSRSGNCIFTIAVTSSVAQYTLGNSAYGACLSFAVKGTYAAGATLTIANTATMQVTVNSVGPYTITTDTSNGIIFSATGTFTTTGVQLVTLHGAGKPVTTGQFFYTVTGEENNCSFSVNVAAGGGGGTGGTAVYTLGGSPGNCAGFAAAGTYATGTALTSSNTVTAQVNVTTAGTYSITTNTVNGIIFSGSGTFTGTGAQPITLTGTGTPLAAGSFNYTPAAGSSTCTFSITSTGGATASTFSCDVNGTLTDFSSGGAASLTTTPIAGTTYTDLNFLGTNSSSGASLIINLNKLGTSITAGSYDQGMSGSGVQVTAAYTDASSDTYSGGTGLTNLNIVITSITATKVQGTFTGQLKDSNGTTVTITNGSFTLPIQ